MAYLTLLGGVALEDDRGPVTGPAAQRRRLALLARLALAGGQGVTRDKLIAALWPDQPAERGRHLLSDSIYRIHRALGGDAIVATGDQLRLNPAVLRCDVAEVEAALAAGDRARAVELYRGPLLDGFHLEGAVELDQWFAVERTRLTDLYADALEGLAGEAEGRGDHAGAVRQWRRLAALDPLSSRAALRLVAAMMAAGDPAAALHQAQIHGRILREELGDAAEAEFQRAAAALPPAMRAPEHIASIAVLPFVNRSAGADDAYFSDGLADELLDLLAKIKGLRVSARASSFHFRSKDIPLADIGRTLNVATLLDGSVRRAGSRVRISVQLVKVSDGYQLWSGTYDRTLDDIFAVQEDIARSVVRELRRMLLGEAEDSAANSRATAEVRRAAKGRSTDPEAHRLYLLARHFMDQFSREATTKAITCLTQAVERDPGFALAWTELSVAYVRETGWELVPVAEGYERARQAVERALALEPALAEGYAQIAWISIFHDWNWPGAIASLARALELAPGSASILRLSGVLASVLDRPEEAIEIFRRALDHDPLSAAAYHSLGLALHVVDDFAGAQEAFRRSLELAPQRIATHAHLALMALAQGQREEALVEARRESEDGFRLWALAIVHHTLGDRAESEAALRRLIDEHAETWALQVAEVQAVRGEVDAAFEWLDRAYVKRDNGLAHVKTNPRLRSLHRDQRWDTLLSRIGFEGYSSTRRSVAPTSGRPIHWLA